MRARQGCVNRAIPGGWERQPWVGSGGVGSGGLAVLLLVTVDEVAFRVKAEEALLEAHFGDAWREHARATWAVLPVVW